MGELSVVGASLTDSEGFACRLSSSQSLRRVSKRNVRSLNGALACSTFAVRRARRKIGARRRAPPLAARGGRCGMTNAWKGAWRHDV